MIRKIFFFILLFNIISSCGYKPLYNSKNINFSINVLEKNQTRLNNKIESALINRTFRDNDNKINIKLEATKEKISKSKNKKGKTLIYEITINLKVYVINEIDENIKEFSRSITYNNNDDKFQLKQYENELEEIIINKLVNDTINHLSSVK